VLLAAWIRAFLNTESVLEIGTGTGVIACILKAANSSLSLSVIEPDKPSYEEACTNFKQNGFVDIKAWCLTLQEFIIQNPSRAYDCVVCNPPYFIDSTLPEDNSLRGSKHNTSLSSDELASISSLLCAKDGRVYLIVPFQDSDHWIAQFRINGFGLEKKLDVKGRENKPFNRSLLCFKLGVFEESICCDSITLFSDEHRSRTEAYDKLVGDLYLK